MIEDKKQKQLQEYVDKLITEDVMVAFSGGVDSSLLLKMACDSAKKTQHKVYALTLHTMLHQMNELEVAQKVAEEIGAIHMVLKVDELEQAGIIDNPKDRCYLCKRYLFEQAKKMATKLGVSLILEGTNEDDLHVYRPGIRAIKELGIISPLAECGMTKQEVRSLAKRLGVSVSSKPSTPCLATRFPYGTRLSYEAMHKVELGEKYIRSFGIDNVRLRVHGDIARIEVDESALDQIVVHKNEIIQYLKQLNYRYITMDLEGFRSGSMDIN